MKLSFSLRISLCSTSTDKLFLKNPFQSASRANSMKKKKKKKEYHWDKKIKYNLKEFN